MQQGLSHETHKFVDDIILSQGVKHQYGDEEVRHWVRR